MSGLELLGSLVVVAAVTVGGTWLDRRLRVDPQAPRFRHGRGETADQAILLTSAAALEKLTKGRCRCRRRCAATTAEVRLDSQLIFAVTHACGRCDGGRTRYYRLRTR